LIESYYAQKAFWDETIAQYRATIVEAFREVADALVAEVRLAEQRTAQEAQVAALQEALDLSLLRYKTGLANYIEVLVMGGAQRHHARAARSRKQPVEVVGCAGEREMGQRPAGSCEATPARRN